MTAPSLQLSANLSFLFTDSPFEDRFARAARAGFRGVEYMFPYACDAGELSRLLREHRLQQVLHNLPAGDWDAGERGIACLPGRESEFREGVEQGIDYARQLGCSQLNCLAGVAPDEVPEEALRATVSSKLRHATRRAAANAGVAPALSWPAEPCRNEALPDRGRNPRHDRRGSSPAPSARTSRSAGRGGT